MKETLGEVKRQSVKPYLSQFSSHLANDYIVVGIIGAQSSGKSTLLNNLFDTEFSVMDAKCQRKQTTKGIWTHVSVDNRLMLLDIEGADSRERWEEKTSFEKRTALFGLVLSNALIINVWLQEIGRFSAANYEILKLVFELNLRFFKTESAKKIVFVIRDYNDRENSEFIRSTLIQDVERLWNEVPKPDQYQNISSKDVFEVEVFPLHNYIYEKPLFMRDVDKLRERLSSKHSSQYLFKDYKANNIPFDAMFAYMQQIWTAIVDNKDINIPNQKVMVSSYRCGELKNEALKKSIENFTNLRSSLKTGNNVNLREEYENILKSSVSFFEVNSAFYDPTVVEENQNDLKQRIDIEFESLFKEQNEKIIDEMVGKLVSSMKTMINSQNESSASVLKTIVLQKDDLKMKYTAFLERFNFEEQKNNEYHRYFNLKLTGTVTSFLSSTANSFIKKIIRNYMKIIDDLIFDTFQNFTIETWEKFNAAVSQYVESVGAEMHAMKRDYEEVQGIFTDELIHTTQKDFLYNIKSNLQNRKLYINDYLLDNFKRLFELNSSGARRNWRALSDSEIEKLFKISNDKFQPTLRALDDAIKLDYDNDIVLSKEETLRIKNKFSNQINDVLENAFNKKYNKNSLQRVPKWLWVVLAYFMHDNILEWMRNPFIFLILIFASVAGGYLIATGKLYLVKQLFSYVQNFVMAKIMGTTPPVLEFKEEERRSHLEQNNATRVESSVNKELNGD